jgi:hypothetical protein
MTLQLRVAKTIKEISIEKYLILPGILKVSSCTLSAWIPSWRCIRNGNEKQNNVKFPSSFFYYWPIVPAPSDR